MQQDSQSKQHMATSDINLAALYQSLGGFDRSL